ncbi:ATP-binding cassette domain-containing protein [Streptomyces sp. NPDC060198]|uniref:ATP-binding cassette domain-containing protein n=1 Tax=Streptomyces sp. NPDC060198 TaxID=3347070 RepID=UPI0036564B8F
MTVRWFSDQPVPPSEPGDPRRRPAQRGPAGEVPRGLGHGHRHVRRRGGGAGGLARRGRTAQHRRADHRRRPRPGTAAADPGDREHVRPQPRRRPRLVRAGTRRTAGQRHADRWTRRGSPAGGHHRAAGAGRTGTGRLRARRDDPGRARRARGRTRRRPDRRPSRRGAAGPAGPRRGRGAARRDSDTEPLPRRVPLPGHGRTAPHRTTLFSGTLRDNVAVVADSPARVDAAVRAAACGDFAADLDVPVGEGGNRLSGGQRQRVALARALASDAPVLVLHDPTTAVDSVTEHAIAGRLRGVRAGRSTLLITSAPALLAVCDRVVELSDNVPATSRTAQ